jgi:hypothetical protein
MIVLVLLVVLAVLVGAGVVAVRLMRANADPRRRVSAGAGRSIDPFTLGEPWRFFVRDALNARARFEEAVGHARPGPLRERLVEIGKQLDDGVDRTWATARQGQSLREARRRIDTNRVGRRIAQLEGTSDPNAEGTLASLRAQLSSAERLDRVTAEAESRLRLLQAQLDEAVARAAELSVKAGDVGELAGVGDDIAHVVEQMEALRLALEETSGGGAPTTS